MMPRVRNRYQCQRRACGKAFWSREINPQFCSRSCSAKERVRTKGLLGLRPGNNRLPPEPPVVITGAPEPTEHVERLLRAVQRRKAYEAWKALTKKDHHA